MDETAKAPKRGGPRPNSGRPRNELVADLMAREGISRATAYRRLFGNPSSPPLLSVHMTANADMIQRICRFYVPDGALVADVTYGFGAFWRGVERSRFRLLPSDLFRRGRTRLGVQADFRALPYADGSLDVVVLDPPYIHNPGEHQTDRRYGNAATTKGFYHEDIIRLYAEGMREAWRVLRPTGQLWVKCKDQVETGGQRWSHIELYMAAQKLGFSGRDLLVLIPPMRTRHSRWKRQFHARKVHSYLWVFDRSGSRKFPGPIVDIGPNTEHGKWRRPA